MGEARFVFRRSHLLVSAYILTVGETGCIIFSKYFNPARYCNHSCLLNENYRTVKVDGYNVQVLFLTAPVELNEVAVVPV